MDKIEGGILSGIPPNALTLTLTRSAIKMLHSMTWEIDKTNAVHDLVICLQGSGSYFIEDETTATRKSTCLEDLGQRSLDVPEERGATRVEVPLEDVSVEGVEDDGGRAPPARRAAALPIAPAFAVCVWRMCGRSLRISSAIRTTERASWRPRPRAGAPGR